RSADPHQRRDAGQQLPAVADRVFGDLGDRAAVARLQAPRSARGGRRLSEARPPLRRHQTLPGGSRREMTRVASGAVLIALAVAIVWAAPDWLFFATALLLVIVGARELVTLARASALEVPGLPSFVSAALAMAVVGAPGLGGRMLEVVLMAALVGLGLVALGAWRGGPHALASVSASLFPALYLGLPIGALVAARRLGGPQALFLLMLTIIVSDSMQYYTGRLFGRHPL